MNNLLPAIPAYLHDVFDSIAYFMPEIYLSVLFLVLLITGLLFKREGGFLCKIIAIVGIFLTLVKGLEQIPLLTIHGQFTNHFFFSNMLIITRTAINIRFVIDLLTLILLLYFDWDEKLKYHSKGLADLYAIVIAAVLGLHLMVISANLLMIFLSIEMVSLGSYLLVAYRTENKFSAEAGMKYVLFGAASSAVMLYGLSLLYGFTGSLGIFSDNMIAGLSNANATAVAFAMILVLAGIGFKLSFVPMHFWVPDIYEGASTPVTAFLSTLPKIAGFGLLINFLTPFIFYAKHPLFDFHLFLSVVAIVTMIAGNFAAVMQNNVKRMLAYSSIGHTGFALMGIITFNAQGISALVYYLLVYGIANIATLVLASYFTNVANAEDVNEYKGLGFVYPAASVFFVILLISLTGLPVTAGFTGKLFIFSAVYGVYQQHHDIWLLLLMVTGALTTVVSLFYYIKIPLNLFIKRAEIAIYPVQKSRNLLILAAIISLLVILLGVFPDSVFKYL